MTDEMLNEVKISTTEYRIQADVCVEGARWYKSYEVQRYEDWLRSWRIIKSIKHPLHIDGKAPTVALW